MSSTKLFSHPVDGRLPNSSALLLGEVVTSARQFRELLTTYPCTLLGAVVFSLRRSPYCLTSNGNGPPKLRLSFQWKQFTHFRCEISEAHVFQ